jgi:hypothetical protein
MFRPKPPKFIVHWRNLQQGLIVTFSRQDIARTTTETEKGAVEMTHDQISGVIFIVVVMSAAGLLLSLAIANNKRKHPR